MPSSPLPRPIRRCLQTSCAIELAASTACATRPPTLAPPLQLPVAATLRAPCPRPDRPDAPDLGALAAFSLRQEAALNVCEARKDAAVGVLDAGNAALRALAKPEPRRWPPW